MATIKEVSANEVRDSLSKGICPYCGKGVFRNVLVHVSRKHHIKADELRVMYGFYFDTRFTTIESRQKHSVAAKHSWLLRRRIGC